MPKSKQTLILDRNAPVLRKTALPVPLEDIGSKKIGDIIATMKRALHHEEDGVAIAAPQVGVSLRIFVVKDSALHLTQKKRLEEKKVTPDLVFINPEIVKVSKKKHKVEEGCLSVRWLYGHVSRHEKISIKAFDENDKRVNVGASGLLSQIFQHEIDHLDGILFIDKAENVRDLPPTTND